MGRINIGGLLFDNVSMKEAIGMTLDKIRNFEKPEFALVANQDIINKKKGIPFFSDERLNRSYLTFADGYSIVVASKILKTPIKERIAGPDFMMRFIEETQDMDISHFFLGSSENVLEKMIANFKSKFSGIKIAGYYSPPFCREFSEDENSKIINLINNSKCAILWVSFGCPKQEAWIVSNIDKLRIPVSIGVGAAFDFHSGLVKRAPLFMQNMKLEWLYRFFQDPKRLWSRYFGGGWKFAIAILKQKYSRKKINKEV